MVGIFSQFIDDHLLQYVHPIVDKESGRVHFWEVLSRVEYMGKIYGPNDFLQDINVEQRYRLAEKLFQAVGVLQKRFPTQSFSINISSIEIDLGLGNFLSELTKKTEELRIDTRRCIIEVTECSVIDKQILDILWNLKSVHGFRFALDDFGAERSTFKQLAIASHVFDYVKIDGYMVENIDTDNTKQIILGHILGIIKAHGKKSIVEYVSSKEVYEEVVKFSPDFMQGFVFCEPAPIETFMQYSNNNDYFFYNPANLTLASC